MLALANATSEYRDYVTGLKCRYDSRRFIGTPTGKRNVTVLFPVGWIEIRLFDSFPRCNAKKKKKRNERKQRNERYPSENSWMLHSEVGDNIYRYILPVYTSILTDLSWKVGGRFLSCKWLIYISPYFHLLSVLHSSKFLRWIVQFIELSCSSYPFLISNASYFYSRYFWHHWYTLAVVINYRKALEESKINTPLSIIKFYFVKISLLKTNYNQHKKKRKERREKSTISVRSNGSRATQGWISVPIPVAK